MNSSDPNWEFLRSVIRIMNEQRHRNREHVREAVMATTIPVPEEVVRELVQLNPQDAHDVLRNHPGFPLWEKLRSYETSLKVFEQSVEDLLCAIQKFAELSHDEKIFNRAQEKELNSIEQVIQKELFSTVNAAHALVDHSTRRLQKSTQIPGYEQRLAKCIMDDGLHDFIIGLRTIIHHIQMLRPDWQVTRRFGANDHQATFKLDRDELLLVVQHAKQGMNESGQRYLENALEKIDLKQVFEEYRRRVREFHSWLSRAIEAQPMEDVRDYERCLRESRSFVARTWWKAMLKNWLNWDQPPNPYNHLDGYLAPGQLEDVYKLPMGSKEQVDKVIEFVDTNSACDDELRDLVLQLFHRASP